MNFSHASVVHLPSRITLETFLDIPKLKHFPAVPPPFVRSCGRPWTTAKDAQVVGNNSWQLRTHWSRSVYPSSVIICTCTAGKRILFSDARTMHRKHLNRHLNFLGEAPRSVDYITH